VKKKDFWILPGGKPDFFEETDKQVLKIKFKEELSGTEILTGIYYKTFQGIIPHKKDLFFSKTYFCYIMGQVGEPSSEISAVRYVDGKSFEDLNLSEITKKTLQSLVKDNLI